MKIKSNVRNILLIVIISSFLILSMVFMVTGAWFTASASSSSSGQSITFRLGTIGDVNIEANDYVWKNSSNQNIYTTAEAKSDANDSQGEVREFLLPGDKVTCGSVILCYDESSSSSQSQVFYLIKIGNANTYYTISNHALATATTAAGLINAGTANALTINGGSIVSFSYNNTSYSLDGSNSSKSISDVYFQGKTLAQLGASYGGVSIAANSEVYKVAIIQSANMSSTNAFELLQDILDEM